MCSCLYWATFAKHWSGNCNSKVCYWMPRSRNIRGLTFIFCAEAAMLPLSWNCFCQCSQNLIRHYDPSVPQRFICTIWQILSSFVFVWVRLHKKTVVQDMTANESNEIFSTTEKRTACIDASFICIKMCAKVRQCLSNESRSPKRKTRDLHFASLGYQFLQSRRVKVEKKQSK